MAKKTKRTKKATKWTKSPPPPPLPAIMLNLTIGHWISSLIHVAAKLKIADLLKDEPKASWGDPSKC